MFLIPNVCLLSTILEITVLFLLTHRLATFSIFMITEERWYHHNQSYPFLNLVPVEATLLEVNTQNSQVCYPRDFCPHSHSSLLIYFEPQQDPTMFHIQVYSIHLVSSRAHVCLVNVHCSTLTLTGSLWALAIAAAAKQKLTVVPAIH